MLSHSLLAGLALLGASSASPAALKRRQTQECSSGVHVIAIGGANSTDPYAYGLLETLAESIVARIPGSDMVSLPYEKMNPAQNPSWLPGGIANLKKYVTDYHTACPDNKIALAGYSSGAIIAMNSICGGALSQDLADNTIISTSVYGDETRTPGQSYDLGTCTANGGTHPREDTASCGAYIPGIQSYCDINDPQCCGGPGEDYEIHFSYPGKYDSVASEWVAQRWAALGGSTSSSSSSSSTSSTSSLSSSSSAVIPEPTSDSASVVATATTAVLTTSAPVLAVSTGAASPTTSKASSATQTDGSTAATSPAGNSTANLTTYNPANGAPSVSPSWTMIHAGLIGTFCLVASALL